MNARMGLLLTPREASNILGVDAATVAKWAHEANLAYQVGEGGKRRYVESEILWLRDRHLRKRVPDDASYVNKSSLHPTFTRTRDAFDNALRESHDKRNKAEYKAWLSTLQELSDAMVDECARLEYERGVYDASAIGNDRVAVRRVM